MSKPQPIAPNVMASAAEVLRAVAHPLRLRILELMEDRHEHNVGEIQEHLGVRQSIASTQLALLRDRGVLGARRDGVQVYYSVINPAVLTLLGCIRKHEDSFVRRRYT